MSMGYQVVAAQLKVASSADHASVVIITLFVALLCACIVLGHLLEENRWLNESITALIIGLCTGGVILMTTKGKSSHVLVFSEDLFFIYLLPPIIFIAGFQVKKKQFFRNFMTITLFGAVGTMISFFTISLGAIAIFSRMNIGTLDVGDFLAIGAIFSATDSVCTLQVLHQDETPFLYSLVFGEGVVNDATSVVLFNAVQKIQITHINAEVALQVFGNFLYLFSTSTLLGIATGLITSFVLKKLYFARHSTTRELAIMMLMAYLSYMLAELFSLSGILTVFFCGVLMSHVTWHNVTESSRITSRHVFAMLSFIAETFIFLYVGTDALDFDKWKTSSLSFGGTLGVSALIMALVLLGRAAFVFPLSVLTNFSNKHENESITFKHQVIIWWAGLMRGAVSIALAFKQFTYSGVTLDPVNAAMVTNTTIVVLFTTLVFGLLTKPLIRLLMPHRHLTMLSDDSTPKSLHSPLLTSQLGSDLEEPTNIPRPSSIRGEFLTMTRTVHRYWRKFDDAFMRPMFGGRGFVPVVPGSPIERSVPQWSEEAHNKEP
uniref:Na+/H+ antiporter NHX5 n=1 Tax=Zea mays TaxID=4577 RepID=Q7XYX1_MAIZE|nr:Na+/H+ antiporter NHX5 [Zea mays subsp. mays]